jgi:hypothetical protein
METAVNQTNENHPQGQENYSEKSELMRFFEYQITDSEWAYKDLLKAILEAEAGEA